MRWAELSGDLSTWTIPAERAKNRRAHLVHLSQLARAVLGGVPREEGQELVFAAASRSADGKQVQITGFSDVRARLQAAIAAERAGAARPRRKKGEGGYKRAEPVADWRLHDFRRTGVTRLAGLGVAPHVADRILNHVHGAIRGVAAVYQRNEFLAERRAALELWTAHVEKAAGLPAAKVKQPRKVRLRDSG